MVRTVSALGPKCLGAEVYRIQTALGPMRPQAIPEPRSPVLTVNVIMSLQFKHCERGLMNPVHILHKRHWFSTVGGYFTRWNKTNAWMNLSNKSMSTMTVINVDIFLTTPTCRRVKNNTKQQQKRNRKLKAARIFISCVYPTGTRNIHRVKYSPCNSPCVASPARKPTREA